MPNFKIELHELDKKPETEVERAEYCAAISAVFPRLEKDIKHFQIGQLEFIGNEALSWEQVLLSRGTFNALDLLLQYWQQAHLEHQSKKVLEDPAPPIKAI